MFVEAIKTMELKMLILQKIEVISDLPWFQYMQRPGIIAYSIPEVISFTVFQVAFR